MKIIVKNADFVLANAAHVFRELEDYTIIPSRLLYYHNGETSANASYQLERYIIDSKINLLRISGRFLNTSVATIYDENDNIIDVVTKGVVEDYTIKDVLINVPSNAAYVDVCHYKEYNKPKVEGNYSIKKEGTSVHLGNSYVIGLLAYDTGLLNTGFSEYKTIVACVDGLSKVSISGDFTNCCALVFYADRELTQIVSIAQNNNSTLGTYTLTDSINQIPSGAKYAASCSKNWPTLKGIV